MSRLLSTEGKDKEPDWPCASSYNYKANAFSSLLPLSLFCTENSKLSAEVEYCECLQIQIIIEYFFFKTGTLLC